MKIGLLITARLKSSRLPLKLLLDLNGKTIIEHVIDRAKLVENIDQIVLCSSTNKQDKPLTDIAVRNNLHYYLGNEEDVLQRLLDASKFFGLDYIISITGENPLFSIEYANRTIDIIKNKKSDLTFFEGLPVGCAVYGIKTKALEVVCKIKSEIDTEIWGPLLNRPELFNIVTEKVSVFYNRPELRITNDYLEDYTFLSKIFSHFAVDSIPSLFAVLTLLDDHKEYLKINGHKQQTTLPREKLNRIDYYFRENKDRFIKLKEKIYTDDL